MSTPGILNELIDRFRNNLDAYKSPKYNEAQLRGEFINPFFEALGWDVYNKRGYAEAYKDVIQEDAIKVGGATKAPDYSFRIGGARKFFLETKKPSVNIKDDPEPAFQLRRYAWSAKLPLSVLTDFEEFAVYDCRIKPAPNDKPSTGRIMYFTYNEYPDTWDDIASVFSRDAILKGSFDRFVESGKKKRGTAEVDDAFLKEIESWRDAIARNIALRNEGLTERDINYAVQLTIDRVIFLRICEDRGIEEYGRLMALQNGEHVYKRMVDLYYRADEKYNSGLFHFQKEKGRPADHDELTPGLKIDDKVLKDIIKGLYYPESPYEFSVLPVDILGHVYERFLGKVIRLTAGGRAKVEEKPEVRKAGGVYYTPKYIVDYIVKNTVGRLLWGDSENRKSEIGNQKQKLTPKQAAKLRILDPACGSGSFLIGAYEYLLDWHRDWYVDNDPLKYKKQIYQGAGEQWYLTTAEKKRILLNNIYGVDIDAQAVEVTKLNLLLKALEGESEETIESQLKMFRERALPDLRGNIKCGNSLIGPDFYDDTQLDLLDDEERYRINAFDWEGEFGEVMDGGGFDAVIGNPPYVRSQQIETNIKSYFTKRYEAAAYQPDTFAFFIEKGIKLLRQDGRLGFIIPNGILTNTYYSKLRRYILSHTAIKTIVDLKDGVFSNASVDTSIFILEKEYNKKYLNKNMVNIGVFRSKEYGYIKTPNNQIIQDFLLNNLDHSFNTNVDSSSIEIISKIDSKSVRLSSFVKIKAGMKVRKEFVSTKKKDKRYKRFLLGGSVKPYNINWNNKWVCYDRNLESKYSNQAFRDESIFLAKEKLLVRQVVGKDRIYVSYDDKQYYVDQTVYVLLPTSEAIDLKIILGILSSKLISYYFTHTLADSKATFPKIKGIQINNLPMFDFNKDQKKSILDNIQRNVISLIDLSNNISKNHTSSNKNILTRQVDMLNKQIDNLVYKLYGLGEEERRVVEG